MHKVETYISGEHKFQDERDEWGLLVVGLIALVILMSVLYFGNQG